MEAISPIIRGLINGFSLGNMLQQQQIDQRRMAQQERQQAFDQDMRQADLIQRVTAAGGRPVTQGDQYEMDTGTKVTFNEGLPITGGPSITSSPSDLTSRVLQIPGGGPRVVLPSLDESMAREQAFNQRTLLDRNRAEAERKAMDLKLQEEAAARQLEVTGIPLPADLARRYGMEGRKVLPTQLDDIVRADTYRQSVSQPAKKEVINTYRYQGPGGLTERVVFKDGTFQETPLNGQQLPARSGSGRAKGGAGGARKLTPAQEADELTGEVLKGTRSASIEDAIKNATTYFQNDPRFTPGRRAQVVQRLKRMQSKGEANPFFQANAAPTQASGQAAAPAAAKIASKANVAAYAQAKGITEAQALADFQKSGYTVQ